MNLERWEYVQDLLHQAMQLAPEQRARFLDEACSSVAALHAEWRRFCWQRKMSDPASCNRRRCGTEWARTANQIEPAGALESGSLAIMDHPAIAKVFDAGATTPGQPYFVMLRRIPMLTNSATNR